MRIQTIIYFLLFFLICPMRTVSMGIESKEIIPDQFYTLNKSEGLSDPTVYCFLQDREGYVWIGTANGLNRYDGYRMTEYRAVSGDSTSLSHSRINCMIELNSGILLIGTDQGINRFDKSTGHFSSLPMGRSLSAKFFCLSPEGLLWIGTNNGLFQYNLNSGTWIHFNRNSAEHYFPGDYVPCGFLDDDGWLYTGSHNCFCKISPAGEVVQLTFPTPASISGRGTGGDLLLSIHKDLSDSAQWFLGTEKGLWKVNTRTGESKGYLPNNPIKTLLYDNEQNLWIGTDNGLVIYDQSRERFVLRTHNIENKSSLINNVVWSIFKDADNTMWLGTANGISLYFDNTNFRFVSVKNLTGVTDGIEVSSILQDEEVLWLGGSNGLIRHDLQRHASDWFKAESNAPHALSHNKVRFLYPDANSVWIATDGGLNRYDRKSGRIISYVITEPSGLYNSNWMYSIAEDRSGALWLGTYEGGIFVVDKEKLLGCNGVVAADRHFNNAHPLAPLSENIVNSIVIDSLGSVWAATDNYGVNHILHDSATVRQIRLEGNQLNCNQTRCLSIAPDGRIWLGTENGLSVLSPDKKNFRPFAGDKIHGAVSFMTFVGPQVWFSSPNGLQAVDLEQRTIQNVSLGGYSSYCSYFHPQNNTMYIGSTDGFLLFHPDSIREPERPLLAVTNLLIANKPVEVGKSYHHNVILQHSMSVQKSIRLDYNQNSFALEFSSFCFDPSIETGYGYRLKGLDDEWQFNDARNNKATFINVPPGNYLFEVCSLGSDGLPTDNIRTLAIEIRNVWFKTLTAKILYVFLFLALLFWIRRTVRMKHRFNIERVKMNQALTLIRSKTDFFVNASEEFVTPLNTILSEVGRLTISEREKLHARDLKAIQQSAKEIQNLLTGMLLHKEENIRIPLLPSSTLLPLLVEGVFERMRPTFEQKQLKATLFCEDVPFIFQLDQAKIETALTHLLTNSIRFTAPGGEIGVEVRIRELHEQRITVGIEIADSGCGIPAEELPKVFDRYYQAGKSPLNGRQGSGIGLSVAKAILEEHDGSIRIDSIPGHGTKVTLLISSFPVPLPEKNSHTLPETIANGDPTPYRSEKESEEVLKREEIDPRDEQFMQQITALIDGSLSDPDLNVEFLCKKSGYGNKYVYRKIKQNTGMNVVEYIRSIRIKKAAMLLKENKLPISEIMYLVGFSNHSYFTKCFRNQYDVSPKEYMKQEG